MSLQVDIEKTLGAFHLSVRFETGSGVLSLALGGVLSYT